MGVGGQHQVPAVLSPRERLGTYFTEAEWAPGPF